MFTELFVWKNTKSGICAIGISNPSGEIIERVTCFPGNVTYHTAVDFVRHSEEQLGGAKIIKQRKVC